VSTWRGTMWQVQHGHGQIQRCSHQFRAGEAAGAKYESHG
jgi:hypothetical protein